MTSKAAIRVLSVAVAMAGSLGLGLGLGPAAAAAVQMPAGSQATLIIETVPVVKNARVILDGGTYVTDTRGAVSIPTVSGDHHVEILPPVRHPAEAGVRFSRWMDGIAQSDRIIAISQGSHVVKVGFEVSQPIAIRFVDQAGQPVSSKLISRVTLANSIGQQFTFSPDHPPQALAENRVVRDQTGLHPLPIRYSVRQVIIDGSNVVYSGRQNFFVQNQRTWTVKLLLFSMRIKVRDALFGFPIGSAVHITQPNGVSRIVSLRAGHAVTLARLPRATYMLSAKGLGFGLSAPSTLSKPQDAKLLLFSWVDVLAVVGFLVLFIVGLPVLGGRVRRNRGRIRLPVWYAERSAQPREADDGTVAAPGTEPASTGTEPASTGTEPASTRSTPSTTRNKPATTRSTPSTTRNKPASTRNKPGSTRNKPATTRSTPSTTRNKPASTRSTPASTGTEPASTGTQPGSTGTQPGSTRTQPGSTRSKPGSTGTQPGSTRSKPDSTTSKPASTTSKPASTRNTPASTKSKPGSTGTEPGSTRSKPASTGTEPEVTVPPEAGKDNR